MTLVCSVKYNSTNAYYKYTLVYIHKKFRGISNSLEIILNLTTRSITLKKELNGYYTKNVQLYPVTLLKVMLKVKSET